MIIDVEDYDDIHKIIVIGDSNTGKTSLIGTFYRQKVPLVPKPTIGVEYTSQTVIVNDYKKVKVQIWDTAGQEKYKAITLSHYRNAVGAMIVFDLTNRQSYLNVSEWLAAVRERADTSVQVALIGNKNDLERKRCVTKEQAQIFAENQNMIYSETSATDSSTVKEAFTKLVKNVSTTRKVGLKAIKIKLEEDEQRRRNNGGCIC